LCREETVKRNLIRPAAAVLLFALAGQAAAQAVLVEARGTVDVLFSGAAGWRAAEEGMTVEADTVISTGFRSTVLIQTGSSRIHLQPVTRLTLEEIILRGESEAINLSLRAGRIRVDVSPPRGNTVEFAVRSPIAVASVRGTSFEFDTVNLAVDNGLVRYSYINGITVYAAEGEASYAEDPTRRVVPPQELAAADRIPRIPFYTGIEETPAAPRYPGISPAGNPPGAGTGLILLPNWIPPVPYYPPINPPANPPLGNPPITPPANPPLGPPGITLIPGWIP
jgi:hypothetical protein